MGQRQGEIGHLTAARQGSGPASWAPERWHAEGALRFPARRKAFGDLASLFREFVTPGHAPDAPLLRQSDTVVTLGSCFAAELRALLEQVGFGASSVWVPSGLNNTYAIRDFLAWVVTGTQPSGGYRYDRDAETGRLTEWTPDAERQAYRAHLERAGAFVFTLGLAEVWEDRQTGAVFWRGVPEHVFEEGRHVFRLSTVEQNLDNLREIVRIVRLANPQSPIVFTLSPVPLKATFRPISRVTADCVSKSVLRVALDLLMQEALPRVYYWPSFEMVRWVGAHAKAPSYGLDDGNPRHVSRHYVLNIIDVFVQAFYDVPAYAAFVNALDGHGYARDRAGNLVAPG